MKESEDERQDPLSGASNNNDEGDPTTFDSRFGFRRSRAALSKLGWGGWVFVIFMVIIEVAFILSVIDVGNDCPLLLLRLFLQIAIYFVFMLDILFIIRCHQIRKARSMPRVLALVAKLPHENPEILEFQASKANALSCCGITTSVWKVIWIRFQDESIQLPRLPPLSDEEEAGMYAVMVWQDQPFAVGDPLEVVLLEGDPSKALYLPFQEQCLQDAVRNTACSALFLAIALFALSWTGPIFNASMSQVEAAFSWPKCSISQRTMIEYYVSMLTPAILVAAFIVFRLWIVAKVIRERDVAGKREVEQSLLGDAEMPIWKGDGNGVHSCPDRLN